MEKQMRKFITASLLAASAAVAAPAVAELQFYGTYENESLFNNETYVHNSAINAARLGVGTERFYLEVGAAENQGEFGTSYEAGYSLPFWERFEFRGEIEGYQLDTFDGDFGTRVETQLRVYF